MRRPKGGLNMRVPVSAASAVQVDHLPVRDGQPVGGDDNATFNKEVRDDQDRALEQPVPWRFRPLSLQMTATISLVRLVK